ncbi:mannitol dehydrogenase family protein [soil metagenome]
MTRLIELSDATLALVADRGTAVPTFDRRAVGGRIVHIGVGGFHRAHLALYTHELAERGSGWGIHGLGLLAQDAAMAAALGPQDGLYSLIERGRDEPKVGVIGSIVAYHHTTGDPDAAVAIMADPDVAIVSMTVTEAGYKVDDSRPAGDDGDDSTFGLVAHALDRRRSEHAPPVTILSCDNLPGNGDAARIATMAAARRLEAGGAEGLVTWIEDHCTFPNSMVDRITPATTDGDRDWLQATHGIADRWPVVAEPFRQWVIEDRFANGRPAWEDVGVLFTDDVHAWELYKLRMLNAAHSCMAYLCALAGITYVDEGMSTPSVRRYLEALLADEAIPSLTEIPGHPREDYAATVLERFGNTGVRDQIARLCIDGTAKFPTFLVPTIEHHLRTGGPIARGTLALAGWWRYLATVPDEEQSPDTFGVAARRHARNGLDDPVRFLDFDDLFGTGLGTDERFRSEFGAAAQRLTEHGPLAAMDRVDAGENV